MNKQEFFDTVTKHLAAQNERSENDQERCVYRIEHPDIAGAYLRCAVGAAIPDELYDPAMDHSDGLSVDALLRDFPQLKPFIPDFKLAIDLQCLHDDADYPGEGWKLQARYIGKEHNLDTSAVWLAE